MTTDPDYPPPPYTPSDPLTPATTQPSGSPLGLRGGDAQIPAYSPSTASDVVHEGSPPSHAASDAPGFSSATAYFEHRGLCTNPHDDTILHQLFVSPADRAEDMARIPLCWRQRTNDLTQEDMSTFANFLLPPGATTRLPLKLRADVVGDEKAHLSPTDTESDAERRARMSLVVSEWNEAFFYPRGLLVELVFVPHHPPHAARGLDPICQSCVAANNSTSRYAAQAQDRSRPPLMSYGMGVPSPPPSMWHRSAMFPRGFPPVPPTAHGPGPFPHGAPLFGPYARMPFGFGHFRGGMERLASGRGRSRGHGHEECFARRGEFPSNDHRHPRGRHDRRARSPSSSSSSSSSSSGSDHGRRPSGRHAGRDRGPGRGRAHQEALGHHHERHCRRRARSSSTGSSSSSGSEVTVDSVSARDVRGLGLQAIISGIAAAKLEKEGEKFGLKMDKMSQKLGFKMEDVVNKVDAKLAVMELKAGLKQMKRENPSGWKKELKEVKRDLKQQMKEIKRERKGEKREARERRRERKKNESDERQRGERRGRGREESGWPDSNNGGMAKGDADEQITGVTQNHDPDQLDSAKEVKI